MLYGSRSLAPSSSILLNGCSKRPSFLIDKILVEFGLSNLTLSQRLVLSLRLNVLQLILKVALLGLPDSFSFDLDRSEVHISKPYVLVRWLVQILVLRRNYCSTQDTTTCFELIIYRVQVSS